jgi:hypothetical protein
MTGVSFMFVNDRPALAVGIAFLAGLTLGWMVKR